MHILMINICHDSRLRLFRPISCILEGRYDSVSDKSSLEGGEGGQLNNFGL